jgi:hypothetical protein
MELLDFIKQIADFESLKPREKILLFAWFLRSYRDVETFDNAVIRNCFREISASDPNVARELPRMADKKPPDLIRLRGRYQLEGSIKRAMDRQYGIQKHAITVAKLLTDLPAKIPDLAERAFLNEAISCYRVEAFRATTVMVWNLAFDHLVRWIIGNAVRLKDFNAAICKRYPAKGKIQIKSLIDFEEFKESEIIEICGSASLIPKNGIDILREKLKRRNAAAHPSSIIITQTQVDDTITDLINNIVLAYTT